MDTQKGLKQKIISTSEGLCELCLKGPVMVVISRLQIPPHLSSPCCSAAWLKSDVLNFNAFDFITEPWRLMHFISTTNADN